VNTNIDNEDEVDRSIMTEFTIFNVCAFCGNLNFKEIDPKDCSLCGTGRVEIEIIIQNILIRQAKIAAQVKTSPCKVCNNHHP